MIRYILLSFGIIYFWFGFLKFFPGTSPAEVLAGETIFKLTFGLLDPSTANILLATMECSIGIGLIFRIRPILFLKMVILHLAFTFTPAFLLSESFFQNPPFVLTIVGQYIIKNILFISAAILAIRQIRWERDLKNTNPDANVSPIPLERGASDMLKMKYLIPALCLVGIFAFSTSLLVEKEHTKENQNLQARTTTEFMKQDLQDLFSSKKN